MTTIVSTATVTGVEWGVRHAASPDRATHVDIRADAADAHRWARALRYTGNRDTQVVTRLRGDWVPAVDAPEREIVALYGVASYLTYDAMAHRFGVSQRTIRRAIRSAVHRFGAVSPCHAVVLAVLSGHIDLASVAEGRVPPWPDPLPLRRGQSPRSVVKAVMIDA